MESLILGQPNVFAFVPGVAIIVGLNEVLNKRFAIHFE